MHIQGVPGLTNFAAAAAAAGGMSQAQAQAQAQSMGMGGERCSTCNKRLNQQQQHSSSSISSTDWELFQFASVVQPPCVHL
jgi:hypothetical protein